MQLIENPFFLVEPTKVLFHFIYSKTKLRHTSHIQETKFDGLQYIGAQAPLYWSLGSNILEPLLVKNMFFVLFSNMNHGELKVPSPFGRPLSDTQNLVLSELSVFIPPQNIENKILGLQYIGAPKCS